MNPEAKIESAVVRYVVRELGGLPVKLNDWSRTGYPDRLFLLPGAVAVFVEFKAPDGKLSKKQRHTIKEMEKRGFVVYVVDTVEEAKRIINAAYEAKRERFW